jgi:hypothetical protein
MPSVISTSFLKQATHIFDGLWLISVPQTQHNIVGKVPYSSIILFICEVLRLLTSYEFVEHLAYPHRQKSLKIRKKRDDSMATKYQYRNSSTLTVESTPQRPQQQRDESVFCLCRSVFFTCTHSSLLLYSLSCCS